MTASFQFTISNSQLAMNYLFAIHNVAQNRKSQIANVSSFANCQLLISSKGDMVC